MGVGASVVNAGKASDIPLQGRPSINACKINSFATNGVLLRATRYELTPCCARVRPISAPIPLLLDFLKEPQRAGREEDRGLLANKPRSTEAPRSEGFVFAVALHPGELQLGLELEAAACGLERLIEPEVDPELVEDAVF